jgi:hypothetical protein
MRRGFGDNEWFRAGLAVGSGGWWGEDQTTSSIVADSLALIRVVNGSRTTADVLGAQRALNRLPSSQARLVVDGRFGPKAQARLSEYLGRATGGSTSPGSTTTGGTTPNVFNVPPKPQGDNSWIWYAAIGVLLIAYFKG